MVRLGMGKKSQPSKNVKRVPAAFFQLASGREPVREWLLSLDDTDRKEIGADICTAEFGWPIGMPLCRSITGRTGLWEVRSNLTNGRIGRVFFCIHGKQMILLHAIIKKTQQTPARDLNLAEKRMKELS